MYEILIKPLGEMRRRRRRGFMHIILQIIFVIDKTGLLIHQRPGFLLEFLALQFPIGRKYVSHIDCGDDRA